MNPLAPTALLTGAAIDDPGDPHLAPAGHIRLFPYPTLGLPVAPIRVFRWPMGDELHRKVRNDILWIDSHGVTLTVPFQLAADNPVTGWLPNDGRCIWIDLSAEPRRPTVFDGVLASLREVFWRIILLVWLVIGFLLRLIGVRAAPLKTPEFGIRRGRITIAEIEPTVRGDAVVQKRSTAPWQLAGSHIRRIRVSGDGGVFGVRWLDALRLEPRGRLWREWTLPHDDAPRYLSRPTALDDAETRVARGAPGREALYDAPAATAATAPVIADPPGDEVNRVTMRFAGDLETALHRLVADLSKPAAELTEIVACTDELTGTPVGSIAVNLLAAVQTAGIDPGLSRWLGFADTDHDVRELPTGTLVLYRVEGWWDGARLDRKTLLGRLLLATAGDERKEEAGFADSFGAGPPEGVGRLLGLGTIIPLIVGVPPDRPAGPALGTILSGAWNTTLVPPAAARQVTLPLSGLAPGGLLAFVRADPSGPQALHEAGPDGGALPVSAAILPDASGPGQGELYDRTAPPAATTYRVAQTDWFGRWSGWAQGVAAAVVRPGPPRPFPELFYSQPALPNPMHSLPLSGLVRIRVGVPQPAQLAPGSQPVDNFEIVLDGAAPELIPVPSGATELDFVRAGPALPRAGVGIVTLVCRWRDTSGRFSAPSPEIKRDIRDPRPPPAVVLPETLAYGSRPDVTGKSRIQLAWAASPGAACYRVYYSDETTLMTSLEREGAATAAIRTAIAAAPDAAARAAIFVANKGRFDKTRFEVSTPDGFAATSFEHRVSGSLRVLVFYRVVPMSAANVETPFGESSMVPFGIPNSGPPATPLLGVTPVFEAGTPQAAIHIRVPRGPVEAAEYRLRRSAVESREPLRMPVAATGAVPPLDAGAGPEAMQEVVSFRDLGGSELKSPDPLRPWTAYSWSVEVRGGPEPGSSVAGEWSPPSAPVTTAIVPPEAPPAPADGQWDGAAEISFTHPDLLIGGSMGDYSIDLYEELPGQPMALLSALSADAPAAAGGRDPDRTGRFRFTLAGPPASGTRYRGMITDPGGRTSSPSAAVLIP